MTVRIAKDGNCIAINPYESHAELAEYMREYKGCVLGELDRVFKDHPEEMNQICEDIRQHLGHHTILDDIVRGMWKFMQPIVKAADEMLNSLEEGDPNKVHLYKAASFLEGTDVHQEHPVGFSFMKYWNLFDYEKCDEMTFRKDHNYTVPQHLCEHNNDRIMSEIKSMGDGALFEKCGLNIVEVGDVGVYGGHDY